MQRECRLPKFKMAVPHVVIAKLTLYVQLLCRHSRVELVASIAFAAVQGRPGSPGVPGVPRDAGWGEEEPLRGERHPEQAAQVPQDGGHHQHPLLHLDLSDGKMTPVLAIYSHIQLPQNSQVKLSWLRKKNLENGLAEELSLSQVKGALAFCDNINFKKCILWLRKMQTFMSPTPPLKDFNGVC